MATSEMATSDQEPAPGDGRTVDGPGATDARERGESGATDAREQGESGGVEPSPLRWLRAVLLTAVNLPIVVASIRGLAEGYQPVGDNGILLVRARDVATVHNPLLGSWTSASLTLGTDINNPGPLYFDLLAAPIRLLGPWVGLVVGVMLVNMAASTLAVVVARRIGGVEAMVAVALVVAGLQFAMGSALLYDVWQPNALVLPFFAYLVVVVAFVRGDPVMLPWAIGLGTLLVQTHLSHVVLVIVLTAAGAAGCVLVVRRRDALWPAFRRPVVVTGVVTVLLWAQPVVEQFTGRGEGNLTRILTATGSSSGVPIGWDRAPRLMAEIMVRGPWFTRDSYGGAIPPALADEPLTGVFTVGPAVAVLVVLAVALVVAAAWAWRSGRRDVAAMNGVALLAASTALVALAMSPVNPVAISVHQMRWLWPVAALVTAALLTALFVAVRSRPGAGPGVLAAATAVVVVVAGVNLPAFVSDSAGPSQVFHRLDEGLDLLSGIDELEGRGPVLYDPTELRFGEPYSGLTFAVLQDNDIPFYFDDEVMIRQFGEGRRNDGSPRLRMWQVSGTDARVVPPGAERIGFAGRGTDAVGLFIEPID